MMLALSKYLWILYFTFLTTKLYLYHPWYSQYLGVNCRLETYLLQYFTRLCIFNIVCELYSLCRQIKLLNGGTRLPLRLKSDRAIILYPPF